MYLLLLNLILFALNILSPRMTTVVKWVYSLTLFSFSSAERVGEWEQWWNYPPQWRWRWGTHSRRLARTVNGGIYKWDNPPQQPPYHRHHCHSISLLPCSQRQHREWGAMCGSLSSACCRLVCSRLGPGLGPRCLPLSASPPLVMGLSLALWSTCFIRPSISPSISPSILFLHQSIRPSVYNSIFEFEFF